MRIVFAPDSYGRDLTAPEACAVVASRLRAAGAELVAHPMADGGQGTGAVLTAHRAPLRRVAGPGHDPLGLAVSVDWFSLQTGWFLESAQVLGLDEDRLDPRRASSAGLATALRERPPAVDRIIVGLGGSGTVDGGLGLAAGLGLVAVDDRGHPVPSVAGAAGMARVAELVGTPTHMPPVEVWCDVRTPVAACVARFGPQKGVPADDVAPLTAAMVRWTAVLNRWRVARGIAEAPLDLPGGGAAGGVGFALAALLDAPLHAGSERVAALTDLHRAMVHADVVVIGEGRLDETSLDGKVADVVIAAARRAGAKVAALVGEVRRPSRDGATDWPDMVEIIDGYGAGPLAVAADRLARRLGLGSLG